MAVPSETPRDTLVTFLPHRLNRQPVVVRGLTADELWFCAGLSAVAGFALGLPLAWLTHSIAMVPTLIVAGRPARCSWWRCCSASVGGVRRRV